MRKSFILEKIMAFNKAKTCLARLFYKEPLAIQNLRKFYQDLNQRDGAIADRDLNSIELYGVFEIIDKAIEEIRELFWDRSMWMVLADMRYSKLFSIENINKILKIAHNENQVNSINDILIDFSNSGIDLTQQRFDQVIEHTEAAAFSDEIRELAGDDKLNELTYNALIKRYQSNPYFVSKSMNTLAMGTVDSNSILHRFFGSYAGKPTDPLGDIGLLKTVKTFLQAP